MFCHLPPPTAIEVWEIAIKLRDLETSGIDKQSAVFDQLGAGVDGSKSVDNPNSLSH